MTSWAHHLAGTRQAGARQRRAWLCALALGALPLPALCDSNSGSGLNSSASASLKFTLNIDKFIYLRLGNPGGAISNVQFMVSPSVTSSPASPANGNNQAANWNGAAPGYSVSAIDNRVEVEVRSNGGQVALRANTLSALTTSSGSATIPMSQITVSSSQPTALPAPPLANSGTGTAVNVPPTSFAGRVTVSSAFWTFSYAPATMPMAGDYSGQVQFTATIP